MASLDFGRPEPSHPPSRWPPPSRPNSSTAWAGGNMSASPATISVVALQIDGDELPAFGERREVGAEHLDRSETAMQQDERSAGSVGLVIELDAVHVRVVAQAIRLASPGALRGARAWCLSLHGAGGRNDRGDGERRGHGSGTHCRVSSGVLATGLEALFSKHDERGSQKSTG